MTTLNDSVIETYRRSMSSMREETDQLGASVGSGATSLTLQTGQQAGGIQPGAIVQVDWELFYVTGNVSSNTFPVIPGYYDSTTTSHTAGALMIVNPRFPAVDVIKAVNQTLDELSSPGCGLFQALEVTLSCNPVLTGYDLTDINTSVAVAPQNLIDLLQISTHEFGPAQQWPKIPLRGVRLERNADTSFFPSGMSLKILDQSNYFPGQPIRVLYKAPYNITSSQTYVPLANPTDDILGVSGLHTQAHDILPLGAMCRLMEVREFKRSFIEDQPQPRRATEVPVGSSEEAVKLTEQRYVKRIQQERARLANQYPVQWV